MPFINGSESPIPYSERKLQSSDAPWDLVDLVEAQNMECAGADYGEIAQALGRTVADVRQALEPQAASSIRQDRAVVGFSNLKRR